jgi:RNA polymerase sigma-70 factor (ECF subfamily)
MAAADDLLVKKAQTGDKTAFGELVRRYQDQVFGLTSRMLDSPEDARDAAQEIFIKLFRFLPGFDFRSSFTTWLYKVATNFCLDLLRKQSRDRQHRSAWGDSNLIDINLPDIRPGPEEQVLAGERIRELKQAIRDLPEDYRAALILHHYQGLSYQQIAGVLDLSEKTVATRIHRAKNKLRERMRGGAGDAVPESKEKPEPVSGWRMPIF